MGIEQSPGELSAEEFLWTYKRPAPQRQTQRTAVVQIGRDEPPCPRLRRSAESVLTRPTMPTGRQQAPGRASQTAGGRAISKGVPMSSKSEPNEKSGQVLQDLGPSPEQASEAPAAEEQIERQMLAEIRGRNLTPGLNLMLEPTLTIPGPLAQRECRLSGGTCQERARVESLLNGIAFDKIKRCLRPAEMKNVISLLTDQAFKTVVNDQDVFVYMQLRKEPVCQALADYTLDVGFVGFEGTVAALLEVLAGRFSRKRPRPKKWPGSPEAFGKILRLHLHIFEQAAIKIEFRRSGKMRRCLVSYEAPAEDTGRPDDTPAAPPSPAPSPEPSPAPSPAPSPDLSPSNPGKIAATNGRQNHKPREPKHRSKPRA